MLKKDIYNKTGMIIGLLSAILGFILLELVYNFSKTPYAVFSFLGITVPVTAIFLNSMYFRAVRRDLPLTFFQILRMSWWITIISTLLFSCFYYYFITIDEIQFIKNYIQEYRTFILQSKEVTGEHFIDSEFNEILNQMDKTTVFDLVSGEFIKKILVGSVASLIVSVILRK